MALARLLTEREEFLEQVRTHNPNADLGLIGKAYDFGILDQSQTFDLTPATVIS